MKKFGKILLVSAVVFLLGAGCNKIQPIKDQGIDSKKTEQANQQPANLLIAEDKNTEVKPAQDIIKYNGQEGKNALEILKSKYTVETKSFGSVGEFVESINGIKPDSKHFWEFFVNGKSSSIGAGSYITKSTDVLEWKLGEVGNFN